jgi:hypothetical protein
LSNLLLKGTANRLRRHVHTSAVDVELPAVIHAAKTVFFVATEIQACPTMRAELGDQTNPTLRRSKRNQPFSKKHHASGWAISLKLPGKHERKPVRSSETAEWRARAGLGKRFVVGMAQHVALRFP